MLALPDGMMGSVNVKQSFISQQCEGLGKAVTLDVAQMKYGRMR